MLYDIFKDKLFPEDPIEEEAKSILDSLGSITETAKSFEKTMNTVSDPAHVAVAGYKALTGVLTEVQSGMKTFIKKADEAAHDRLHFSSELKLSSLSRNAPRSAPCASASSIACK